MKHEKYISGTLNFCALTMYTFNALTNINNVEVLFLDSTMNALVKRNVPFYHCVKHWISKIQHNGIT